MALAAYSELKAAGGDFLNRQDLVAVIPTFIRQAEAQMNRRLVVLGVPLDMVVTDTLTITSEYTPLPTSFLAMRSFQLAGETIPLDFVEPEEIARRKGLFPTQTGKPLVWSIVGGNIQVWPFTGSPTFSAEIVYTEVIPPLSDTDTTNWMLEKHPDVYLYGALMQSAPYLKDDGRIEVWGTLFTSLLGDVSAAGRIGRTSTNLGASASSSARP